MTTQGNGPAGDECGECGKPGCEGTHVMTRDPDKLIGLVLALAIWGAAIAMGWRRIFSSSGTRDI